MALTSADRGMVTRSPQREQACIAVALIEPEAYTNPALLARNVTSPWMSAEEGFVGARSAANFWSQTSVGESLTT